MSVFQDILQKRFWQSLFTPTPGAGRTKFTFEELRALYDVLAKNQVVTEANKALVVETIRSIAEFMIWGDQNEPRIFDFFLENNIMTYLHRVLQQPANRTGDVAKQVLQTLSIIIQNIRSETGVYFLFSNNHINNIVEIKFDFDDEEVLGYYISFLKTISLRLTTGTVQFFFDNRGEGPVTFPLYTEAVKFAHHKEGMVRAGVRTLTLNVYSVPDPEIQQFVISPSATGYFADMASYISEQIRVGAGRPGGHDIGTLDAMPPKFWAVHAQPRWAYRPNSLWVMPRMDPCGSCDAPSPVGTTPGHCRRPLATFTCRHLSIEPCTSFPLHSAPPPTQILDKRMLSAEGFNAQVLSSLDSQVAEVEDMVSYVADVLATGGRSWVGRGGAQET